MIAWSHAYPEERLNFFIYFDADSCRCILCGACLLDDDLLMEILAIEFHLSLLLYRYERMQGEYSLVQLQCLL